MSQLQEGGRWFIGLYNTLRIPQKKTIFVIVEYPQYPDIKDIKGTVS